MKLSLAATVSAFAAAWLLGAPTSHALLPSISPGDELDYTSSSGRNEFCTLGYTYSGTDGHTYGITAGHCDAAGHIVDRASAQRGTIVRALVDPPHTGGADYGLIDFGTRAMPMPFIGDSPLADEHHDPVIGQRICHTGAPSGRQCGHVTDTYGPDQYLTADMARSIPGDSGGPVWTVHADGRIEIIGIWLGGRTTGDGRDYGRFGALTRALTALHTHSVD